MTSTGLPTSKSSTAAEPPVDAETGARRPPVSHVPSGTWLLAPTRRLAGARTSRPLRRRALLRRTPLRRAPLRSLLGRSALGRRTPLLRSLLRWSPLDGPPLRGPLGGLLGRCPLDGPPLLRGPLRCLPSRSPLHSLTRGALGCFLCGSPLFCGLSGRGPSLRGYCHRCTSLGAWSLNRGEACATSRTDSPRRAHCRTGFIVIADGWRSVVTSSTLPHHTTPPWLPYLRRRADARRPDARHTISDPTSFAFARHTSCRSTCQPSLTRRVIPILLLSTCSGQAFLFVRVIFGSLLSFVRDRSRHEIDAHAAYV